MKRADDYQKRREHLARLDDQQLEERFWNLVGQLVDPLLQMGRENTTPAIERSVLLRMGFSSLEARDIVQGCLERGLLGHGAGHVVYKLAKSENLELRAAGLSLVNGENWEKAAALFAEANAARNGG